MGRGGHVKAAQEPSGEVAAVAPTHGARVAAVSEGTGDGKAQCATPQLSDSFLG